MSRCLRASAKTVCLEILYRVWRNTTILKVSAFFVIIRSKATHFREKYIKIILSKSRKHNKNITPFSSYYYLLRVNVKKYWKKKFFVSACAQKGLKTSGSGNTLPYLPNPKNKISSKINIYMKYICLTFNWQNSQNDFIKRF